MFLILSNEVTFIYTERELKVTLREESTMERNNRLVDLEFYPTQYAALATRGNEILAGGSKGGGKCLCGDTPIITTVGWKKLKEIQVGDYVFNEQGEPTKVIAKSDTIYERTFKVWIDKFGNVWYTYKKHWVRCF